MIVYVQALGQSGENIAIRFSSPWLKTATLERQIK